MNGRFAALMAEGQQVGGLVDWKIDMRLAGEKPFWAMTARSYYWLVDRTPDEVRLFCGEWVWHGSVSGCSESSGELEALHNSIIVKGFGAITPMERIYAPDKSLSDEKARLDS